MNRLIRLMPLLLFPLAMALPEDPEAPQFHDLPGDFAASHILISWKGADRADAVITRNKDEALARAQKIIERINSDPSKFENIARSFSDGPSKSSGGSLGSFKKGDMAGRFEAGLKKLEVGEYTKEPVKTGFGYHIIRRNSMRVKQYAARALILSFTKAIPVNGLKPDHEILSEEEATSLINEIRTEITAENFVRVANEKSHLKSPTAFLGVLRKGQSPVFNQVIAEIESLHFGEISKVVRLPIGMAILQRVKIEKLAGAQILISHMDAANSPPNQLRIRKEAKELAEKLCTQLRKDPSKFAKLAKKHSDDHFKINGGALPRWYYGYREPEFDTAVKKLEPGQITPHPVETVNGFYIIRRDPLK